MPREDATLVLLFMSGGQAQLMREGATVWASDNDEEFRDQFGDEFLDADDEESVIEYLMDQGVIEEAEAGAIEVADENEDAGDEDDDGDEDEDDDDGDPYS